MVGIHNFGWMFVQATVAILILVGFESVTSMGGEAKNAKRDVPIAVITSLLVQGAFCYLFEYFAANYFLNSGYTMQNATGSAAPIGDMMVMVGDALFGPGHGRTFMLIEAFTVFLALIGTTLSCINTGARVTYAMGKDQEVPEHFGMLHDKNLSPHRAIWTLAIISAVFGCIALSRWFSATRRSHRRRDRGAATRLLVQLRLSHARQNGGSAQHAADHYAGFQLRHVPAVHAELRHLHRWLPQPSELQLLKHLLIPVFGVIANLVCMAFYLIGPFMGYGTKMEPFWPWASPPSGPSTAASTSSIRARRQEGLRWSRTRSRPRSRDSIDHK